MVTASRSLLRAIIILLSLPTWEVRAAEQAYPLKNAVSDPIEWNAHVDPKGGALRAEVFVITAQGGFGGPFVWTSGAGKSSEKLDLEIKYYRSKNKCRIILSLQGAPSMSSDLPKALLINAVFPLPKIVAEGDYVLSSSGAQTPAGVAPVVKKGEMGFLLRITREKQ